MDIKGSAIGEYLRRRSMSLEDIVASAMERVAVLETAKEQVLSREIDARASSLEQIDRALTRSRLLQSQLRSASERLRVRQPALREGTWVVHGRVVDGRGRGIPGWTVIVSDERSQTLDRARTGELGYFKLEIARPAGQGLEADRARSGRARFEGRDSMKGVRRLFLQVAKPNGETVHQDAKPMTIAGSDVVYREIEAEHS